MKHILVILPFENVFPPMNGGMQRGFNLLHQLSRHCRVTVVIKQDKESFLACTAEYPTIKNCTVISTAGTKEPSDMFSFLPSKFRKALRYRFWNRSIKGPAEGDFLLMYPVVKAVLQQMQFDYVLLVELLVLNLTGLIRKLQPEARIIYDAYNVNTRLAAGALTKRKMTRKDFNLIEKAEASLARRVDTVFTCSDNDLQQLNEMNKGRLSGTVIPNGVNIPGNGLLADPPPGNKNDMIFCGSLDYFPNQQGLLWFCKEIFPQLLLAKPSARLMVVGKGDPGDELKALLQHDHIIYYGMVDRVGDYYKKAALALVPLLSGSGTRLKLLEAMGYNVAVVATSIGAEGIDYTDGKDIMIADDPASFACTIAELLSNPGARSKLAAEGLALVKKEYDWNVVGDKMAFFLDKDEIPV